MPLSYEERLKLAQESFQRVAAPGSAVRDFSEARRSNGAKAHTPASVTEVFLARVGADVAQAGRVAAAFREKSKSKKAGSGL